MPANTLLGKNVPLLEGGKLPTLDLSFPKHSTVEPGSYIPRADAQDAPSLAYPAAAADKTYLAIGLDIDAPFVSWTGLGPILHWVQPGFKASASSGKLETSEPFVANYIAPAPPPGAAPHRYIFFLYEQPAGFTGKKFAPPGGKTLGNTKRMWTSLDDLSARYGLGEIVAAGYFKSN